MRAQRRAAHPENRALQRIAMTHRFLQAAVALLALTAPTFAQQRLFALDSAGRIWRVDGHTTTAGALAGVAQAATAPGFTARGVAFDPTTQRFFVLESNATQARLLDVDPVAGTTTPLCAFGGALVTGLDRRSDGVLVCQSGATELVLIEPTACTVWRVPTGLALTAHASDVALAWGPYGEVLSMAPDGTALRLDPLNGDTFAPPLAQLFVAHGVEFAANEDLYFGAQPWSLIRRDGQTGQLFQVALGLVPANAVIEDLSLEHSAEGAGVTLVCDGLPNSTGRASTLELFGTTLVGNATLELRCRDLPQGSMGFFLMGLNSGALPVASGVLCIAPTVHRNSLAVLDSGPSGTVQLGFGTTALPVGIPLQAGDSYVFQYWHRDVGSTANFSAARRVQFR